MKPVVLMCVVLACVLMACQPEEKSPPIAERVEIPAGIFAPDSAAIAYRIAGQSGTRIQAARLSTAPLVEQGGEPAAGFLLVTRSGSSIRVVNYRKVGDDLIADVIAGRTYIIVSPAIGQLRVALDALCRWRLEHERRPHARIDLPRICRQIFCESGVFSESELFREFGSPGPGLDWPPAGLGGWKVIPRDYCDLCIALKAPGPVELVIPTIECVGMQNASVCQEGPLLLNVDFELDTIGTTSSDDPAGLPPDDSLASTGDVVVIGLPESDSNAVRIARTTQTTKLQGYSGFGAELSRSFCVNFLGRTTEDQVTPVEISLDDDADRPAWRLIIGNGVASVISGGGSHTLGTDYGPGQSKRFRFDVDVELGTFDLFVDGTATHTGLPLLEGGFRVADSIRFEYIPAILEAFPGSFIVDDIEIRGTSSVEGTVVLLARHAEKASDEPNTDLAADPGNIGVGVGRAEILADIAETASVSAVYATEWCRTAQTGQPTSQRLGLSLRVIDSDHPSSGLEECDPAIDVPVNLLGANLNDLAQLAQKLLVDHPDETVLVVGHGNTVPDLIEALGAPSVCPTHLPVGAGGVCSIPEDEFNHIFTVIVPADGTQAKVMHDTYGAP